MESCEVKSITQQCPGGRGWRMDGGGGGHRSKTSRNNGARR